jgi:glutamyl/glutaminyl-tRNA synthetase
VILLVLPKEKILSIFFTFEFCLREDLNKTAPRVMAVLDPIKLVITIIQKIKKNGWKPKIIKKMKVLESTFLRIIY